MNQRKPKEYNLDPTPTPHEAKMAAYRAGVAGQAQSEAEFIRSKLGEAEAYAYWVIIDKLGQLPERKIPTCRRKGGGGWDPPCPNIDERIPNHPHSYVDKAGNRHDPFRFIHSFQHIGGAYNPMTAEEMAAARAKREAKAYEKEREKYALFPELVPQPKTSEAIPPRSTKENNEPEDPAGGVSSGAEPA